LRAIPDWVITDEYTRRSARRAQEWQGSRDLRRRTHFARRDASLLSSPTSATDQEVSRAKASLEALGFSRASSFVNDHVYREGRRFRRSREQRAVETHDRSRQAHPQRTVDGFEHEVMTARVGWAGAPVPLPGRFLGRRHAARIHRRRKPGRADARPGSTHEARDGVGGRATRRRPAGAHGGRDRARRPLGVQPPVVERRPLVFIDFPQAVDLALNPHGLEFLHRDIENVAGWFARRCVLLDSNRAVHRSAQRRVSSPRVEAALPSCGRGVSGGQIGECRTEEVARRRTQSSSARCWGRPGSPRRSPISVTM